MSQELKKDGTIVTSVDKAVEEFLRERLIGLTPKAAYWGEEFGYEADRGEGLWVVDPIDGTSNFAFGQPLWGITAGYLLDGVIELGVMTLPELGFTITARRGQGAWCNGEALAPFEPGVVKHEDLVSYSNTTLIRSQSQRFAGNPRHLGSFVVEAAFTAMGKYRAMLGSRVMLYDAAAGILACRELGADVRMLDGRPWDEKEWMDPKPMEPFAIVPLGSGFSFGA
jgi:myo-inositol-1(or 4)-monophosphatase